MKNNKQNSEEAWYDTEEQRKKECLKTEIELGLQSGIAHDFDPKKHLVELKKELMKQVNK